MIALLLLACDSTTHDSDSAATDLDPATVPLAGPCALEEAYGGFRVQSTDDGAGVDGNVTDGVVPISVLEEIGAEGDCKLLRRNNPFCDPACGPGETCTFEGECIAYPSNQDLGTVSVSGLLQAVSMEPVFPGNTYYDSSVPDPPFEAGSLITLRMPEGTYGPLQLHGVGVEPLVPTDEEWAVEGGVELVAHWEAPTASVSRSEVLLSVNVDQHGTSPGAVYCTFEDDGEGTVPPSLLQDLVDAGVTGFPTGTLSRRTVDSAALDGGGCMDFTVSTPRSVAVDVIGFTPCVSTADCPDGMECDVEFQVCY